MSLVTKQVQSRIEEAIEGTKNVLLGVEQENLKFYQGYAQAMQEVLDEFNKEIS